MTVAVVLVVLAMLAAAIVEAVATARRRQAERLQRLRAQGFEPLPDTSPVAERLADLHSRGPGPGGRRKVANLHERRESDRQVYLFDLRSPKGEGARSDALVGVVSPGLRMPRFRIGPRPEPGNALASLANLVLEKLASLWGQPIRFPDVPEFDLRYLVMGAEEGAVRAFLTEERLRALAALPSRVVEAEGDLFTVDRLRLGVTRPPAAGDEVAERVAEALELHRVFSA